MFSNKSICSPEDREAIALTYNLLADAIKDAKLKTPIIFTSVGSRPRLGIVPELNGEIGTQNNVDWNDVARQLDVQYLRSEFMFTPEIEPEPKEVDEVTLTEAQSLIIQYAKEKPNEWLTPSFFTNNKEYFKSWKSDRIIELFSQLAELGYGETISGSWNHQIQAHTPLVPTLWFVWKPYATGMIAHHAFTLHPHIPIRLSYVFHAPPYVASYIFTHHGMRIFTSENLRENFP
jgi:hypothetical protein